MVLLNEGLTELANQFKDLINEGQWGTGTTTPAASDTGLETPVVATLLGVTTNSSSASAQFTHTVGNSLANGSDLTEYELQFVNNDSLNRTVGGPISKKAAFDLTTISTVNFVRG